jgi:SSS family transporter
MQDLPLETGSLIFLASYVLSLLAIGWFASRQRQDRSLGDYYLGGRGMGLWVLMLTLFATQYSGNALFGFTGQAYRVGFTWLAILHSMIAVVAGYLLFAPRLQRLSREQQFITPTDYVEFRFPSRALSALVALCFMIVLINYVLAQLKVMGLMVAGLSGGQVDAFWGVVVLAIIMMVYSTMGGMRSVAWTDAIQGAMMLTGFILIALIIERDMGGWSPAFAQLQDIAPEKLAPPEGRAAVTWFSTVLLIGIGASVYPQAIQRIYAARSTRTLQQSLAGMAVLPLFAVVVVLALGFVAIARYPGLEDAAADQVMALIMRDVLSTGWFGHAVVTLLLGAILAALMSTADSALLALSSIFAKDIYGKYFRPAASDAGCARAGQWFAWLILGGLVWLSTQESLTLYRLFVLKFEILLQIAPAFYLGVNFPTLRTAPIMLGLITGLGVAVSGWSLGWMPLGLHPGTVGLLCNVLMVMSAQSFYAMSPSDTQSSN